MSKRLVALLMAALVMTTSVPVNAAPSVQETASNYAAAPVATSISLVRVEGSNAVISVPAGLADHQRLFYQISNNQGFLSSKKDKQYTSGFFSKNSLKYDNTTDISISSINDNNTTYYFSPDETVYIRAVISTDERYVDSDGDENWNWVHPDSNTVWGNVITAKNAMAKVSGISAVVSGSSVKLSVGAKDGIYNGVWIQKKVGKKWVDVCRTTGNLAVKDTGLEKNTKYTYQAKLFFYNKETKKTTYSSGWFTKEVTTWGGNSLNLKANASGKNVKLSWKKIPNVVKYEVYRSENSLDSDSDTKQKDDYINGYSTEKLIKTLKKKSTSYTDKKLKNNQNYYYTVKATVSIDGKEYIISESVRVNVNAELLGVQGYNWDSNFRHYYTSKYTVKCQWDKIAGASSILVEKDIEEEVNGVTSEKTLVHKKLKGTATSITLPKVPVGGKSVDYRFKVLGKNGRVINTIGYVTVKPQMAAVKNVKVSTTKDGIKISWKPVAGATGYQIIRSEDKDSATYTKDTKTYSSNGDSLGIRGSFKPYSVEKNGEYATEVWGGYWTGDNTSESRWLTNRPSEKLDVITETSYVNKVYEELEEPEEPKPADYVNNNPGYELAYAQYRLDLAKWKIDNKANYMNNYDPMPVEPGKTYYYTVIAVFEKDDPKEGWHYDEATDNYVNGPYTEKVERGWSIGSLKEMISAMFTTVKVDKVKSLKVKSNGEVSFKKSKGAKGYYIYRSTKKSSGFTKVGQTTKLKFKDTTATKGKKYYYRVEAYKLSEAGGVVTSGAVTTKKAVTIKK